MRIAFGPYVGDHRLDPPDVIEFDDLSPADQQAFLQRRVSHLDDALANALFYLRDADKAAILGYLIDNMTSPELAGPMQALINATRPSIHAEFRTRRSDSMDDL